MQNLNLDEQWQYFQLNPSIVGMSFDQVYQINMFLERHLEINTKDFKYDFLNDRGKKLNIEYCSIDVLFQELLISWGNSGGFTIYFDSFNTYAKSRKFTRVFHVCSKLRPIIWKYLEELNTLWDCHNELDIKIQLWNKG